jgi:hypothetical protein
MSDLEGAALELRSPAIQRQQKQRAFISNNFYLVMAILSKPKKHHYVINTFPPHLHLDFPIDFMHCHFAGPIMQRHE